MGSEVGDPVSVRYVGSGRADDRTRQAVAALESAPSIRSVHRSTTTVDAIEQCVSAAVDCVVCEFDSPGVDGMAVLDALDDATPFVAVVDSGDGSRELTALERGAARTLRRPPDATGWPAVLVSTVRDAVEQRRLVESAGDAGKRYRSLFENNPLIIWEEDYSASKRRLDDIAARVDDLEAHFEANPEVVRELMADIDVVDVNENALAYYDAPSKAALLSNLDQVFTDVAYESAAGMWLALAAGETTYRWETVGRTLSGERKHEIIELNVPAEYADTLERVYLTAMDITERKRQERELQRQRDRLDEFASVASHDLRNPLTVAEGHLDLAMEDCDNPRLADVAQAHDRMRSLIDDLLALARDGRPVDDPAPVPLAAVVDACWDTVETGDARLVVDTDRTVRADEMRLKRLFENLIRNAVEHGSTGPSSTARADAVTVTVGDLPDGCGFYVEDDGPGIPTADRESVVDAGYTTVESGTGFGLAIVRQVADAHGWELAITAGEDGGARFEFTGVDADPVS
ncbi:ATP-binding response regulator [Haloarcula brevis]|uniref:ATP-binding response regulator n=1 Tax=Haloarcula brevis TaxID=3111453 RepID=UPI00300E9872